MPSLNSQVIRPAIKTILGLVIKIRPKAFNIISKIHTSQKTQRNNQIFYLIYQANHPLFENITTKIKGLIRVAQEKTEDLRKIFKNSY
jgi:CBS domain containing-hemolysin-like protein